MVVRYGRGKPRLYFLIVLALLIPSTGSAWNKDVFPSAYEECLFKQKVRYHAGRCKFFVTVEEKDGWYFFTEGNKKFKFIVPDKVLRRMEKRCAKEE